VTDADFWGFVCLGALIALYLLVAWLRLRTLGDLIDFMLGRR